MFVQYLSTKWYLYAKNVTGVTAKVLKLKICTEANQTLLFKMLQNNFFGSCPLHDFTISQIFSFNRTTEPHNIQLVKIFKTHPSTNLIKLYAIDIYVILGLYSMTILKFFGSQMTPLVDATS